MKRILAVILVFAILAVSLTACNKDEYTPEEKFAARANLTISRNSWYYVPDALTYVFNSVEYYEEGTARVVRADCIFFMDAEGVEIETMAFLISDRQDYLVRYNNRNDTEHAINQSDYTELWHMSLGSDYSFEPVRDNLVNRIKVGDLVRMYRDTGKKSYLGME